MKSTKAGKKTKPRRSQEPRSRQTETQSGWPNDRVSLAWTGFFFLLHSLGLALLYSPVGGIVGSHPIIEQDWGLHFHHLKSLEGLWRQDKTFWGYNPFFMAGYPSNTIQDLSIKLFEFMALCASTIAFTPIQWFKISVFLARSAVPWLMYFAARNLFDDDKIKNFAALSAAVLGTLYWWNSLPREMFFYGMVGYPLAAYFTILGVSLFYRIAKQQTFWSPTHLGWFLFALAILPLHIQSMVIFLPPALGLLLVQPNLIQRNLLLWAIGAAAFSLLANLFWLVPAFAHREDDISSAIVDQLPLFTSADPLTFLKDYSGAKSYWSFRPSFWEKGFRLMLLLLGSWGTWKLIRSEHRALGVTLGSALIILFLIAYFGSLIPLLKGWQPLRFKVPLDLFLVLAASYLIAIQIGPLPALSSSVVVRFLLLCGSIAFLFNLAQTESQRNMKLRAELIPQVSAVAEWIRKEAAADARVLFEESGDETGFVYDGMYLSAFVPYWTGRQLIGGPINLYNDRHHFAEFHSGKLFKKDIQTFTDNEIKNYFRVYNIGAVVAFHPASIQRLQSVPGLFSTGERVGSVHLMKVNQPLTWFLKGEGRVTAGLNRIHASDVRGNEVILKYHWTEGLVSMPTLKIEPVKINDDPIPFVKIVDPPTTFVLRIDQ